jgi:light-regulated signal transduction histidine kinase (bacteriophytochrome)
LFGPDGKKVVATIAQGQDITERKQAEEEIKKLNEELKLRAAELEAANKELEAFSYSVSHDLRSPLRSMEGFSQALQEDCKDILNDECKNYLSRIQNSAELMAQLIDDMLRLSRITRADIDMEKISLTEIARNIAARLKNDEPKRNVKFVVTPELTAYGDGKLITIMIENLFENAWKFTRKVPEAQIEFGVTERNGQRTYFVRDNGVGFDMKYVDKLFKPFQRLHSTEEFPGTGIGLASVQRIVQRHGGRVWAEGKTGEGATFYFTLG